MRRFCRVLDKKKLKEGGEEMGTPHGKAASKNVLAEIVKKASAQP